MKWGLLSSCTALIWRNYFPIMIAWFRFKQDDLSFKTPRLILFSSTCNVVPLCIFIPKKLAIGKSTKRWNGVGLMSRQQRQSGSASFLSCKELHLFTEYYGTVVRRSCYCFVVSYVCFIYIEPFIRDLMRSATWHLGLLQLINSYQGHLRSFIQCYYMS